MGHTHLIQDLASIINNGDLELDSIEFLHICSLVRKMLRNRDNKSKPCLKLVMVPLSRKEHLFLTQASSEDLLRLYTGLPLQTNPKIEYRPVAQL